MIENLGRSYIPGMKDVFGSAKCGERFRTKQPVSVGNDANQNGGSVLTRGALRFSLRPSVFSW